MYTMNQYSEQEKKKYVEEFKKSHLYLHEFAKSKGILVSNLRTWLRQDSLSQHLKQQEQKSQNFGVINLNMDVPKKEVIETGLFRFENENIKIELKPGYDNTKKSIGGGFT